MEAATRAEANDEAVAKAEERAAQHKARLDGVVAQLDSEKEECQRVKAAATEAAAVAAARRRWSCDARRRPSRRGGGAEAPPRRGARG